jgi:hypothetical protein
MSTLHCPYCGTDEIDIFKNDGELGFFTGWCKKHNWFEVDLHDHEATGLRKMIGDVSTESTIERSSDDTYFSNVDSLHCPFCGENTENIHLRDESGDWDAMHLECPNHAKMALLVECHTADVKTL